MSQNLAKMRNATNGFLYRNILKKIFFLSDPEKVHDGMMYFGELLGRNTITRGATQLMFGNGRLPDLEQTLHGVYFKNPIGLSGGFDKNAILTNIIPSVGFGFMEVGSITAKPYEGNPGQRLWRLPKSQSLVVYYGLKNIGAEKIAHNLEEKLRDHPFEIPVAINIAKTNCPETNQKEVGIADYVETYKRFLKIGSFFVINISCPNVAGGQPFHNAEWLEELLIEMEKTPTEKPVFIKISPDLSLVEIGAILEVAGKHHIDGFVCTNLTKRRDLESILDPEVPSVGGLSGKIVEPLANELISYVYKNGIARDGKKFTIIGVGGIFSAQDAYKKIRAGASLLELITGMIFQGPQLISEIQLGLSDLLARDGYKHISEAIGADHR